MPQPPLDQLNPARILLIKPSALGDVVHALPVLSALRRRYPQAQLAALAWPARARGHAGSTRTSSPTPDGEGCTPWIATGASHRHWVPRASHRGFHYRSTPRQQAGLLLLWLPWLVPG